VRILAVVTARGGSKRLPGKNVRLLGGTPLVAWSIRAVTQMPEICDILVSTDDADIADAARRAGGMVPWCRPAELATDTASSVDVCLHALDWYENEKGAVSGLLLLQPTSPFRSRETVSRGLELFRVHNSRPVVAVSPAASHPLRCFRVDGDVMRPFVDGAGVQVRSQDLPPAYVVSGALYVIAPHDLRARRSFYGDDVVPLVVDQIAERIDIDTEEDWKFAEAILGSSTSTRT
jgi:CMP-N,N'-diacetyllegionaminic acid synthase